MVALTLAMALVRIRSLEPDFVPRDGTLDVGHGPARTFFFLSLILCLVPMTPCETMLAKCQRVGGHAEYYALCGLGVPSLRSLWVPR